MSFSLKEILDVSRLNDILASLEEIQKVPSAIIDKQGNILTATSWQDICTQFHRLNPAIEKQCKDSDRYIENKLNDGDALAVYRCPMGLIDAAMPIVIDHEHLGNVFVGQLFTEPADEEYFINQARKYGFDEESYLSAMRKVPIIPEEKIRTDLYFIHSMTRLIAEQGWSLKQREKTEKHLREAEWKFKALFENGPIGVAYHSMIYDETGKAVDYYFIDANEQYLELTGVDPRGKTVTEAFPGIEKDPFDWIGTFGEVAREGKTIRFEQYLQHNDRWYDCVAYQYQPDHFVAAFQEITDRKNAEKESRLSEERFRRIFNELSIGMALCDDSGKFLKINQSFTDIIGYSSQEMTQLTFADLTSPEFHEEEARLFKDLAEGVTSSYKIEKQCIHRDGHLFWASVNATKLIGTEESTPLYIGSIEKIDKEKQLEIALEQTRSRLESLWNISKLTSESFQKICNNVLQEIVKMTYSPYGFYGFLDQDEEVMTIYSWSNEAMQDCEIHNQPIKFPIDQSGIWGNAVRTKKPFVLNDYQQECEFKTGTPEGHVALERVLSIPVLSSGKVVAVAATANKDGDYTQDDIDQLKAFLDNVQILIDRKRVQDSLEDQREYYRVLFEGSPHPTAVADAESGEILACNKQFSELVGFSYEEIIGQHQSKFHHAKPGEGEHSENFEAHKSDMDGKALEDQLATKDGRILDVEIVASKLHLKDQEVLLGFFHDVTEHKKMMEEQRRSSQLVALGTIVAGVAHEINNPVNGVINCAALIKSKAGNNDDVIDLAKRIEIEGARIAKITKNLLHYSKDSRKEMQEVQIKEVIESALTLSSSKIKNQDIILETEIPDGLPEVKANSQNLIQIIINFLENACYALKVKEHIKDDKTIKIICSSAIKDGKEIVCVEVFDNGIGMNQETLSKAKDAFYTTKPSVDGSGLGLSIVSEIVNMHHGVFDIESIEGEFTKMKICLPAKEPLS
ncbi:MAG: hypothetical protein C0623_08850 [Desulfuromonas sp.]|nr:MAG: hypothetical protein C0623_08850 [Desulfuromonas sp.]